MPLLRLHARLLAAATLAAAVLLLGFHAAAANGDSSFCSEKTLSIVAHQDDDLLFQNPDVLESIGGGECVRTVFVTAGDAGLGSTYWHEREEGSRAAYATMAGVPNSWSNSEETFAGHSLHVATLVGRPELSQVYMRLPNGGRSGAGYQSTGFVSLPKLWRSHNPQPSNLTPITQLSALDGSATYTYESLLATLKALILDFEPDVILTQDFAEEFGQTDHGDHIVTARLTKLADGSYPAKHVLRSYVDYRTAEEPVNVFEPQLARKTQVFNVYRAHDSQICISEGECSFPDPDYNEWLKRQVVASERAVPGADAGPAQAVASKAQATLDGSGSSDPLGHSLSYEWTQTGGPAVTLSNSHAVKPTFTAPVGPATLTFALVVKTSEASSAPATVLVTVAAPPKFALTVSTSGNGAGTITSSPAGISCPTDCEGLYDQGTKVTLTPAPAAGSEFKGWSGACAGTGSCEVTLGSAKSVGAEFALQRHQLSVSKTGSGTGTVTSTPAGISCGATCAANFDHGTLVKLTGAAGANSKAVVWETCPGTVNASNQCEVTMSQARSATARFDLEQHALTVTKSGSGSGTVSSSPAGISCGSECAHAFNAGTLVKLTGSPAAGSKAVLWSNCDNVNGANECEVTMSAAKTVTASFAAIPQFLLTINKGGSGTGTVTSSPAGISCGAECTHSYLEGTLVKLTGAAGANSKAVVWEACPGTVNASNQCEVTMSQARAVTARFDLEQHALTVTKSGGGSGTVSSSPAGISCGATCSASFDHGTEVTLSASPAAGSEFKGWAGACAGTGTCKVAMTAAKSVGAEFAPVPKFALSVSTTGNGSGTVTSTPAGIDCPSDCEGSYEQGAKVTLTPASGAGSEFKGWSGACAGTGACEVTMSAAKSVGAEFALQRHQLSVSKSGAGAGTVTSSPAGIDCGATCSASFDHGTEVTLSASPAAGSFFVGWSGACSGSGSCKVSMSTAKSVGAEFALVPKYTLSVSISGNGAGVVTGTPTGIECPSDCEGSYEQGTKVTLTPASGAGSEFKGWSGACAGTGACEVTMSAAKSVGAEFALQRHQLSVTKSGAGSGTVTSTPAGISCGATCSASFDHGTEVTLSASPAAGSFFVGWSGACAGSGSCKVTMTAAKSVEAEFASVPKYILSVDSAGNGDGTISSAPAGINCPGDCEQAYEQGTSVTLIPTPAAGSEFVGWSGACTGTGACEVTLTQARSVTARFDLERHTLTVTKSGGGSGTVSSSPAGISCGPTCAAEFDHGTEVTLSANPAAGSEFKGWSGACAGTGACEVTMSAAKSVWAEFSLQRHQLTVSKAGAGSGTVTSSPAGINCGATCSAAFDHGTLVKLAANPAADSEPVAWAGCDHVSASNECEVTMSAVEEVTATFSLLNHNPLNVTKIGSGTGAVTSSPAGIDCGSQCSAEYLEGTALTLTGAAGAGSEAVAWETCPGTVNASNQCEVTMSQARAVTARFDLEQHPLVVTKTGTGSATVTSSPAGINCGTDCSASFAHGTVVMLSAAPAAGSTVSWSGCDQVVDGNRCKVSMDAASQVAATLTPAPIPPTPTPNPGPSPLPVPDPPLPTPPNTQLRKAKVEPGTATFVFAAQGTTTHFRCALSPFKQKLTYKNCSSPRTYRHLTPGVYVFKVKAVGTGGADPEPVTKRFRVTDPFAS